MNPNKALDDQRLNKFAKIFAHPSWGRHCEWVSTEWMLDIAGQPADHERPRPASDPFIIVAGSFSKKVVIEFGRAELADLVEKGILFAPAAVVISEWHGVAVPDAPAEAGRTVKLWAEPAQSRLGVYAPLIHAKPSDIIPSCPCFPAVCERKNTGKPQPKKRTASNANKAKTPGDS